MNVYFFPTLPNPRDGYSIVVNSDFNTLKPQKDDLVVWYDMDLFHDTVPIGIVVRGPARYDKKRLYNLVKGRLSCEFTKKDLKGINLPSNPSFIFCGDIHFYRVLRNFYPKEQITVRFHNCYTRISKRIELLDYANPNKKFLINLYGNRQLEKLIFNDNNTKKIFISEEDRTFYTSMMGMYNDSEVWGVIPDFDKVKANRVKVEHPQKIVWFGGIQAHKADSVKWFIDEVYSLLQQKYSKIEFHLFGSGTSAFNDPDKSIYGHGRYEGDGMPFKSESIFINPDLTGGGVKVKLKQYFEEGVTFITNPFGYEGYSNRWIDNEYCYCVQLGEWYKVLDELFTDSF